MKNNRILIFAFFAFCICLSSCFVEGPYFGPYHNYHSYGYTRVWRQPHRPNYHPPHAYGSGRVYRGGNRAHSSGRTHGHYR